MRGFRQRDPSLVLFIMHLHDETFRPTISVSGQRTSKGLNSKMHTFFFFSLWSAIYWKLTPFFNKDAWRQVIEKINSAIFNLYKELLSNIELYKKMDVEPLSRLLLIRNNLRSEYFFGLGSPTVIKMIEKLPNARLCRAYNFQYDMIIRIPRTILHSVLCKFKSSR